MLPGSSQQIYCETSTNDVRPYLPQGFRIIAFNAIHGLSHPGIRTTRKLMQRRYFWPSMNTDVKTWVQTCVVCQRSKIQRHTSSATATFEQSHRFEHVHVDIVGPLRTSPNGHRYVITMIDRATRWPEAHAVCDMTAETVAKTIFEGWITRFGCPAKITTDQGRQFESHLFTALTRLFGIKKLRTTPYHPQSNGIIERWHRCMKTALTARLSKQSWVEELPTVLLGLRTAIRTDTDVSAAELTYGQNLRLPGDFFVTSPADTMDSNYVEKLRTSINNIRPVHAQSHNTNRPVFVHRDLQTCKQVFVRVDAVKKPLHPPYDAPYTVLRRDSKTFTLQLPGREAVISIDRLKPAFSISQAETTTMDTPTSSDGIKTSRSGRVIKPPVRFA